MCFRRPTDAEMRQALARLYREIDLLTEDDAAYFASVASLHVPLHADCGELLATIRDRASEYRALHPVPDHVSAGIVLVTNGGEAADLYRCYWLLDWFAKWLPDAKRDAQFKAAYGKPNLSKGRRLSWQI
jgi:hypothetical protein